MVMFFYNYNQRNFAMGTIVPDLSNPSDRVLTVCDFGTS